MTTRELPRGAYETVITEALEEIIASLDSHRMPEFDTLRPADTSDRIALHVSRVIERALDRLPDDRRVEVGINLARRLVDQVVQDTKTTVMQHERPVLTGRVLRSIGHRLPDGKVESIDIPLTPLLDTALLTNAPGEPHIGRQLQTEIASADRIDVIMAFIRRSGLMFLRGHLQKHVASGKQLRVLTTTYTGSTEAEALDLLSELGADLRVSYDTSTTRLHAKAWLFHRESGFSTAFVGSSNLTHSAQVTGLEWNVRVSNARNRAVIEKIAAVFESCWQQNDFEPYNRAKFLDAIARPDRADAIQISPIEIRLEPFQERLLELI
jgi:HKD family nuclease